MFMPILVQIPIFIVLYQIFAHGIQPEQFSLLYSFVPAPQSIDATLFNFINLNERSLPLAVLAGVLQFVQFRQSSPPRKKKQKGERSDMAQMMQTQMMYIFPVAIVWIAASFPAAFALYWISSTVFSLWQHWFISKKEKHVEQRTVTNS
jgi:YidC/Oxa1 family membrane protein insertase